MGTFPDPAEYTVRLAVTLKVKMRAEFATQAELLEVLTRDPSTGEHVVSAHGLYDAVQRTVFGHEPESRIGYTADGNKDAYVSDTVDVWIESHDILCTECGEALKFIGGGRTEADAIGHSPFCPLVTG